MFKTNSYKRGTVFSLGLNIANKGIQLCSILVVSYLFGANQNTDLYYYLFNLLIVIIAGFSSGLDASVLIPEFMRVRETDGELKAMSFINKYLILYLVFGSVFFLVVLFDPISLFSFLSRFDYSTLSLNKDSLYVASFTLIAVIITNLLSSILASYRYFIIPNFIAFVNNLLSILFLLFFYKKFGIISAFVGLGLGYIVNLLLLIFLFIKKLNWNFFIMAGSGNSKIRKLIFSNQLIGVIISLRGYVVQFLLSGLSAGTLTAINWGTQIASLSETFVNSQVYTIVGLKFSEYYTRNNVNGLAGIVYDVTNVLAIFSFSVLAVFTVFSKQIALLFDFKKHFSLTVIDTIAYTLIFVGAITIVNIFTFLSTKLFAAIQVIHKTVIVSILGQLIVLLFVWVGLSQFDLLGYLVGYLLGFAMIAVLNLWALRKLATFVSLRKMGSIFLRNLFYFILCVAVCLGLKAVFSYTTTNPFWIVAIGSVVIALAGAVKILNDYKHLRSYVRIFQ